MVELKCECNMVTLTKILGIGIAIAIIIMSILRFLTLSADSIQQFILTIHFMYKPHRF